MMNYFLCFFVHAEKIHHAFERNIRFLEQTMLFLQVQQENHDFIPALSKVDANIKPHENYYTEQKP